MEEVDASVHEVDLVKEVKAGQEDLEEVTTERSHIILLSISLEHKQEKGLQPLQL